ncbi:MAG TPA: DUF1573 domain-containing protein [Chitinophagales bacterium]|nr:DUF1573 domain-containing protein [Chitinophagales bacterium]
MKKLFFFFMMIPAFAFSQSNNSAPTNANPVKQDTQAPEIQFKEDAWDFGDIPQGTPVTHVFEYSNSGKQPLIVSQATASCGCTTPVWTKEPVMTGKSGTVSVTFNAAREGTFIKTVTVLSNTGNPKYLTIKGNVIAKKSDDVK